MALKFNSISKKINIRPTHSSETVSCKTESHTKTVKKKTSRLTEKSKNILRNLGYQFKQNARK
jgi:hypothetical protein